MFLLPLEVLPGWPAAQPVDGLLLLLLTVVAPVAVGLLIVAITFAPSLRRAQDQAPASTELERSHH